ncbi:MAG: hypothetical protein JW894_13475 [Bacteroidales bacterium]|nr:hypothetical protein [Bacteroidales bacterium]
MQKCICIKPFSKEGKEVFAPNQAYYFEFAPATGMNGQTYHVMFDEYRFEVFNTTLFREFFKKVSRP